MLLITEATKNRLLASMKENKITKLSKARINPQTREFLASYENQLSDLYTLGYREIPKDIERVILAKIQHREVGSILKDQTPNPLKAIKAKHRYATLSNGLFDEMHEPVDSIQYYHALLNTKTKKITRLFPIETSDEYKVDPVVFALSVDPMTDKYPNISPYAYCAWNPVKITDPNGKEIWITGEDGVSFKYTQGMKYEGKDAIAGKQVGILNQINNTKNGTTVISDLSGSKDKYFVTNQKSGKGYTALTSANPNGGATLKMNGNNTVLDISHELFHGYQIYKGQGGASIFNEVEAYLFSGGVATENALNTNLNENFSNGSFSQARTDSKEGESYSNSIYNLQDSKNFSQQDFDNAVNLFKSQSGKNSSGDYSGFPQRLPNQKEYLLKQFYPLYR